MMQNNNQDKTKLYKNVVRAIEAKTFFSTDHGSFFVGKSEVLLSDVISRGFQGVVQLVFTSPPFPLNHKKRYGNLTGAEYAGWLASFAPIFANILKPRGSIVIELGNAWEPGRPIQSLLPFEGLEKFVTHPQANLRLCQEFVCYNKARLPTPAEWVTVRRIRTKDSYTRLWWMAKHDFPKASNRRVLKPYSRSMQNLLARRRYNAGTRPSGHVIGEVSFLRNHGGAIPANMIALSNTISNDSYLKMCRAHGERPHPARMPAELAEFFIKFLTQPGDLILDPFAGSNVTGYVAEKLGRHWISIEAEEEYARQSVWRFEGFRDKAVTNGQDREVRHELVSAVHTS